MKVELHENHPSAHYWVTADDEFGSLKLTVKSGQNKDDATTSSVYLPPELAQNLARLLLAWPGWPR
jgi:hypothetical protein